MKRTTILLLIALITIITVQPALAVSIPGWDWVKGVAGSGVTKLIAIVLTAIIGLGLARYTPIITIISIFIQSACVALAVLFEATGTLFGWVGAVFEDMKISSEEVSQAPEVWKQFMKSAKESFKTISTAWKSMKTNLKAQNNG